MASLKVVNITIPVPWGEIAGKTFGEEKNIPVLCVHGRTDNLESFSQLLPLLPRNQYYVCIDLPGHGKSSHIHEGYVPDFFFYTLCIKRVINHFKWSKLYYMGHSLGGHIGYVISALYPELVLKLIVIDALMYGHVPAENTVAVARDYEFDALFKLEERSSIGQAPTYTVKEFVRKMIEARKTEVTEEQIRPMAERNLVQVDKDRYRFSNDQRSKMFNYIFFTFDQLENIANEICCPAMVILGNKSAVTRPLDFLRHSPLQKNSNVSFHVIEGDHDIHLARPQQVARLVTSFLNEGTQSKL